MENTKYYHAFLSSQSILTLYLFDVYSTGIMIHQRKPAIQAIMRIAKLWNEDCLWKYFLIVLAVFICCSILQNQPCSSGIFPRHTHKYWFESWLHNHPVSQTRRSMQSYAPIQLLLLFNNHWCCEIPRRTTFNWNKSGWKTAQIFSHNSWQPYSESIHFMSPKGRPFNRWIKSA